MKRIVQFLFVCCVMISCSGRSEKPKVTSLNSGLTPDSSMMLHYATGFKVDYFKTYKRVILMDPWKKNVELIRYYLVASDSVAVPDDGVRLRIPIKSLVSGSCTHHTFLQELGALSRVVGICNAGRTYNPYLRKAVAAGTIVDLGDPFNLNLEQCLMLNPQVLMINSYNKQDENLDRLKESGVQILYNNEWMEPHILGRAEWIRFMACLFDKEALADSLFRETEAHYNRLKKMVSTSSVPNPTVLSGDDFRGTWYLPGGKSYTAQLFADAGAVYQYAADTTTGSIPFTFEQVLHDFHTADVWVGVTNALSLNALNQLDERYALFRSFKRGNVWSYTLRTAPGGGNDFWETAVACPDWLLSDFIKVFHPDLLKTEPWHFLKKVH